MGFPSSLNSFGPGYSPWDDPSLLINTQSNGITPQDEYHLHGAEGMHKFNMIFLINVCVDIHTPYYNIIIMYVTYRD